MRLVYFTIVAVALYLASDLSLRGVEALLGRRLEQRSLVFFGILLGSTLVTFSVIRQFVGE